MAPLALKELEELIAILTTEHLSELVVEESDTRVLIRKYWGEPRANEAPPSLPVAAEQPDPEEALVETEALPTDVVTIPSPMVGVFYRAPSPTASPFVSEGDIVEAGQTVGILEAMKIMNDIVCEVPGRVAKILVENEEIVSVGQPLILIEPL